MTDAMLRNTNITVDSFCICVERLPTALREIRLSWRDEDPVLLEAWMSQLDWIMERGDDVFASNLRGYLWRLIKATARAVVPFFLFMFATRFPRIAVAVGLMR